MNWWLPGSVFWRGGKYCVLSFVSVRHTFVLGNLSHALTPCFSLDELKIEEKNILRKRKHDQLIQSWYFFRRKEKIFSFLTLIFQNECISCQKDGDQPVFDFPTFLFSGSLTHSAYASLNQAFILPDRFFRWSPFLAPRGSKHDQFSCVLLNQQLKVPVTLFTVLKRIWPCE